MRILLLDDESFTRRMVTHQLEQLGLPDVVGFEQPLDALAFLEAEGASVDIVLLDLQMPGMDGIEVLRHLARLKFGGGVILLSGEDRRIVGTALTLARAHNLNMLGALHKPVTPPELHALLSTSAQHHAIVHTDDRHEVVQLIGDAAGGESDGLHHLRLAEGDGHPRGLGA